jgi:hypothetical protein
MRPASRGLRPPEPVGIPGLGVLVRPLVRIDKRRLSRRTLVSSNL